MKKIDTKVFEVLKNRGYIYQCTNLAAVEAALSQGEPITFYLGIDPTADSLHIGHFFALMMFRYLQDAGHKGILVIGGATALIGDPSGKSDMRKMLSKEQVQYNLNEVKELAKRFIRVDGDNPAVILNNADWMTGYDYVDFMRDIGIHFNVNTMLTTDIYANRIKAGGLTFLEMGYMLMQSYDFAYLNKKYNCTLQIGGSDQWGNIVGGVTLNRKLKNGINNIDFEGNDIYGLTCPLLLTKDGKKMGKTENGTLWVARDKTTPFDFYQYFYNVNDCDVETLLRLFTRVDTAEIEHIVNTDIVAAKRLMAFEITKLVHGNETATNVLETATSLFQEKAVAQDMPSAMLECADQLPQGVLLIDILVQCGLLPSKSAARRLIAQGGITLNNCKITSDEYSVTEHDLTDNFIVIKKGKKTMLKVNFI